MFKGVVTVAVLSIVVYVLLTYMAWLGVYQRTYNHSPGICRRLQGIEYGSEDIEVLPNGLAFISSGWRVKDTDDYNRRPGRIYLFDFNQPDRAPEELQLKFTSGLQLVSPHGISIWTDEKTGNVYLYVISHQQVETVDKFRFDSSTKTLTHLRRVENEPNFHMINDVAVVDEDRFYYTNFFYASDVLELTFGLRWGSVGYFDGSKSSLVETGLYVPNGIVLSPDRKYVYVAELADQSIRVYRRFSNNSLIFDSVTKVWTNVDNLDIDAATGDLWVGAHPVMHRILNHMSHPKSASPSQILRLKTSKGRVLQVDEMYSNNGSELSASSVGVVYGRGLLIGSVSSHALYCQLQQ